MQLQLRPLAAQPFEKGLRATTILVAHRRRSLPADPAEAVAPKPNAHQPRLRLRLDRVLPIDIDDDDARDDAAIQVDGSGLDCTAPRL